MCADSGGNGEDMTHVGATVLVRWRTHGDENDFGMIDGGLRIAAEAQAAGGTLCAHHILQARFEQRDITVLQGGDSGGKIGRASCRERVCTSAYIAVVDAPFNQNKPRSIQNT